MIKVIVFFIIFDIIAFVSLLISYKNDCKETKPENLETSLKARIIYFCLFIIVPQIFALVVAL